MHPSNRREFFYWTDDGNLAGLRYDQWKGVFMEQTAHGLDVWAQAIVAQHLVSFQQFPPRQRPGSSGVEQAMEKLRNPPSSN